jgi:hypothetical protein
MTCVNRPQNQSKEPTNAKKKLLETRLFTFGIPNENRTNKQSRLAHIAPFFIELNAVDEINEQ